MKVIYPYLFASAYAIADNARLHHGAKVYNISKNNYFDRDLQALMELFLGSENFEVFKQTQEETHVYISEKTVPEFEEFMRLNNVPGQVMIGNVGKLIDIEWEEILERKNRGRKTCGSDSKLCMDANDWYDVYHDLEEIEAWMEDFQTRWGEDWVEILTIGASREDREIKGLKISNPNSNPTRSALYFCAQHAREWLGPASTMLIFEMLMQNYQNGDADAQTVFDENAGFDLYFFPVLNPDGYSYTWTHNRLWRKNRRVNDDSECRGVDLNRNWNTDLFGQTGSSSDPCSNTFTGERPLSEPETTALEGLVGFLSRSPAPVVITQDIHTYSQMWMYPLGETPYDDGRCSDPIPNSDNLFAISKDATDAIKNTHGLDYFAYGSICDIIYPSAGCSVDHFYERHDITCSTTVELRDDGYYGFLMPSRYIRPVAEEMYNGYMVQLLAGAEGKCDIKTEN